MGVRTALLVFQPDSATLRGILCGIGQQVEQNMRNILLIHFHRHLRSIDLQCDILLDLVPNLIHQAFTEGRNLHILFLYLVRGVLQLGERLNMLREIEKCLHLGFRAVKFFQGGIQLGRNVADELSFQCVIVFLQIDNLLLLTSLEDKTEQDNTANHQSCRQGTGKDQESHDNHPTSSQRTVFLLNSSLIVGNLFLQTCNLVGMFQGIGGVLPG